MEYSGLVSIVLTTLNADRFLRESVNSCLGQTYKNFELIVADGGSTDGTLDIVREFADPRIRIIHQLNNEGKLAGAINTGLAEAKGEYLTWMQADCLYDPTAIEEMAAALENNPDVGQVCADFREIDEHGAEIRINCLKEPEEFLDSLGDPGGVCFLIRREVRETIGIHDVSAFPSQDYDYRMRIAMRFKTERLPKPLYSWRVHSESLSTTFGWIKLAEKDVEIRQKLGLSDEIEARKLLAKIYIAAAFESYQKAQYLDVLPRVLSAFKRNIAYACNKGVWSILFKSWFRKHSLT